MTREEHKLNAYSNEDRETEYTPMVEFVDSVIDKIYDDFESRTCENCKHCDLLDTDEYACSSEYMIVEFNTYPQYPLIVDSDFGCKKWEAKDD